MSCRCDTIRCPYCRGDMLTTEHMSTGARWNNCGACGTQEEWFWDDKGTFHHTLKRPVAYVSLIYKHGCRELKYFGKHPYKWLKRMKRYAAQCNGYIPSESFGVLYDKKHKKHVTVFGPKPTIYPDEYYEDDELFY